ncbi:ACT domain-containing protein [Pontibacillus yanchengensis]|uniref:ACT domain-containing protein n=2 Tax=Pontibacillus yanchengensis TaxID=462910 RepID=A0ACC7VFD4_9BACI|nr:ACT domain-containing protein [Pontibacillus yanchengensis]MYL32329.1 ACT domain-containing protein [Pontibacillus yanchengensis]MYL52909.1 ACT domain-containing protein [Pontibacillus yanchengensis]
MENRRAVVSVLGKDQVGIIAKVTTVLSEKEINVLDINQTIVEDFFTMMMIVDVTQIEDLDSVRQTLNEIGEELGVKINLQLEEVFQAMHRI